MQWSCAECGRVERSRKVVVDAVCHHCGKLLCRAHQNTIIDDAFDTGSEPATIRAMHCQDCLRRFHPILFQTETPS